MTTKKALYRRIEELETERPYQPLTFELLTICFKDRTIQYEGRTIAADADRVSLAVTNDKRVLAALRDVRYVDVGGC